MVVTDKFDIEPHNIDWMQKYKGESQLVLLPKTTEEVSRILAYCNERSLAVVPQGGNTVICMAGLVGGSVPVFDEVVLCTSRMNQILAFDPVAGVVTVQAGVVLEKLDQYLQERGYIMPLDLGAKGSCQIGGNVATNAGGIRFLRYGSLQANVLGLEVVLADGTVVENLSTLRKDNTGYHLRQLFIGSEGTLGVITAVSILCPPKPSAVSVAFLGLQSFENVIAVLRETKKRLGEILSAFEFLDRGSLELVTKHLEGTRDPLSAPNKFYVVIETQGSNAEHDAAKLAGLLEHLMQSNLITDGTLAQDTAQMRALWKLREGIAESLKKEGFVYKYDLSLPSEKHYELVEIIQQRIGKRGRVVGYGHVGDGNLHLNISTPKADREVEELIEPFVYQWTAAQKGSISAEHGLGFMKPHFIHFSKSPAMVKLMYETKRMLDPKGILNPYKVLPAFKP